jgi:hypothetical protein
VSAPPRENAILFRSKNAEAAMNAYVETNQRVAEEAMYRQTIETGLVDGAAAATEEQILRPATAEAVQFGRPSYCRG